MKKLITLKQPIHISHPVVKKIDALVLEVISANDKAFYGITRRVYVPVSGMWIDLQVEIGALSIAQSNIAGLEHLDGISSAKESEK